MGRLVHRTVRKYSTKIMMAAGVGCVTGIRSWGHGSKVLKICPPSMISCEVNNFESRKILLIRSEVCLQCERACVFCYCMHLMEGSHLMTSHVCQCKGCNRLAVPRTTTHVTVLAIGIA